MKIALTGATGMVGSRFFDLLKGKYEIIPVSSSYGVDITDRNKLNKFLKTKNPALIVHMAAKTNVDTCEDDKISDTKLLEKEKVLKDSTFSPENIDADVWKSSESAFGINVAGTKNIADFALDGGIKMIYISTDFVFHGEKGDTYSEEDDTGPVDWYGQTKLWGEKVTGDKNLITRISYPFGYRNALKRDLVWTLFDLLKNQKEVKLVSDQIITPTFIDDIVKGLDFLIDKQAEGLFHLTGSNSMSPYEVGVAIAREYNLRESKITTTTRGELYEGRAARPFNVALRNDKIRALGFEMTDFYKALSLIK